MTDDLATFPLSVYSSRQNDIIIYHYKMSLKMSSSLILLTENIPELSTSQQLKNKPFNYLKGLLLLLHSIFDRSQISNTDLRGIIYSWFHNACKNINSSSQTSSLLVNSGNLGACQYIVRSLKAMHCYRSDWLHKIKNKTSFGLSNLLKAWYFASNWLFSVIYLRYHLEDACHSHWLTEH